MRFFESIRWRLQLWHGVMLALVLTALASLPGGSSGPPAPARGPGTGATGGGHRRRDAAGRPQPWPAPGDEPDADGPPQPPASVPLVGTRPGPVPRCARQCVLLRGLASRWTGDRPLRLCAARRAPPGAGRWTASLEVARELSGVLSLRPTRPRVHPGGAGDRRRARRDAPLHLAAGRRRGTVSCSVWPAAGGSRGAPFRPIADISATAAESRAATWRSGSPLPTPAASWATWPGC